MKLTTKELKARRGEIQKFIIESVDLSLYIAHAVIDGEECLLAESNGKLLKRKNILEMKRCLKAIAQVDLILRQRSAYDEMVGHNYAAASNPMELSLGNQPLPEWLQ